MPRAKPQRAPKKKPKAKKKALVPPPADLLPEDEPLTIKQALFVENYLIDLNGTQAAIRAGYSEDSARFIASENLTKPNIAKAIAIARKERADRIKMTADEVVAELSRIARFNIKDITRVTPDGDGYVDLSTLTRDQAAALSSITVEDYVEGRGEDARSVKRIKVTSFDKNSSLLSLLKHHGVDGKVKHEHTGPNGEPIKLNLEVSFVDAPELAEDDHA